ncbi:MAG: hypothetical protein GXP25_07275 [Planctomycetes bacterium]|nr:hypothetical protein [Planctomycetota bacterium]
MDVFNTILTRLFDALLYPFAGLPPIWGLAFVSILTGAVMVRLFGKLTNQRKIRALKDRIRGRMLEMWIFRDYPRVVLKAHGQALWSVAKYAACSLRALVVLIIPVMLIMIQLQAHYGYRPVKPGDSALVRVIYDKPVALDAMNVSLETSDAIAVETPPLRIPEAREVDFRIRAKQAGEHEIAAKAGGIEVTKRLCVGDGGRALSPVRSQRWTTRIFHPAEPRLPRGTIESIEVGYPSERLSVFGMRFHWLWPFFVISILVGLVLKRPFGVEL